jgi:hypothetical protein
MLLSHSYIPYIHIVHAPTPSPKAKLRQRRTRKKEKKLMGAAAVRLEVSCTTSEALIHRV